MQNKKILLGLAALAVLSLGVLLGRSELFTGRFGSLGDPRLSSPAPFRDPVPASAYRSMVYFRDLLRNRAVSAVASAVPSVVPSRVNSRVSSRVNSRVASRGGISRVASIVTSVVPSMVPSVVASAVASAVPVDALTASRLRLSELPPLTPTVLKQVATNEYRLNPGRFTVNPNIKLRMIQLYNAKSKSLKK